MPEAVVTEILINLLATVGAKAGEYGENVELNATAFELFGRLENFEVCVLTLCVNAEAVALTVAVKAQPDQEPVLTEKITPFIGE